MILLHLICHTIILLIFFKNVTTINLKLKWKNIEKKAKNILLESWNKSRGISQVGPKPSHYLDYPGLDNEKVNTNMRLWDLYYKCLEEHQKSINKNNIFQAKVITAYRSSSLNLECELCISPKNLNQKNIWYFSWLGSADNLSLIYENDYFRVSSIDLSLTIINMDESKSGFYLCKLFNSESGPYFIELIEDSEKIIIENHTEIIYPSSTNIVLERLNLKIWNQWTQWSSCSKCGEMGKKTKFGHCLVSLNTRERAINEINMKKCSKIIKMKNHQHDEHIHYLEYLLDAFDIGLPCQSSLLELENYSNEILKNKATKVMIENCEVKCDHNDIFEIKDIQGNIKEKVNNSAGIYSPLQSMPEFPPKVETLEIIVSLNDCVNITCPGNLNSDAPYEWRVNNQILPSTNEKITVDILNRLIVKNITEDDEKIYTCWQVDYLAGIVEIKLIKELKISIQDDIYLYGVFLVLGIFIWIGFKMFFDREAVY